MLSIGLPCAISLPIICPRELTHLHIKVLMNAHSNVIHNEQKPKINQMPYMMKLIKMSIIKQWNSI
jgi:hypothetical protein